MFESLVAALEPYAYASIDKGLIPDAVLRPLIRNLCRVRQSEISQPNMGAHVLAKQNYISSLRQREIAIKTDEANKQHYEVSTEFLQSALGKRMKYSACLYGDVNGVADVSGKVSLDDAEEAMLAVYCERARLEDGMEILDLGCGWGSLALYLAEKYPNSKISALSNSSTQKVYIDSKGFKNLEVYTGDVRVFDFPPEKRFDRILSIEMLEHMKNYSLLFSKINSWLKPNVEAKGNDGALFFAHIFCHRDTPYHFEESDGWMSQMFFSGGTMPSFDLFAYFQEDLLLQNSWWINGTHYGKTCEDWLTTQDASNKGNKSIEALEADAVAKGLKPEEGRVSFYRFRVFFLTCAEFFALDKGETWGVGHYLFKRRD